MTGGHTPAQFRGGVGSECLELVSPNPRSFGHPRDWRSGKGNRTRPGVHWGQDCTNCLLLTDIGRPRRQRCVRRLRRWSRRRVGNRYSDVVSTQITTMGKFVEDSAYVQAAVLGDLLFLGVAHGRLLVPSVEEATLEVIALTGMRRFGGSWSRDRGDQHGGARVGTGRRDVPPPRCGLVSGHRDAPVDVGWVPDPTTDPGGLLPV